MGLFKKKEKEKVAYSQKEIDYNNNINADKKNTQDVQVQTPQQTTPPAQQQNPQTAPENPKPFKREIINGVEILNTEEEKKDDKNKVDGVEVLDFDSPVKGNNVKTAVDILKENKIIFILLIIVVIFVFALPKITSWFSKSSMFSYSDTVNDVIENKTVDGMLEIGKEEGSITAKSVQFYNFNKRTDNDISVVYLPETSIKNVNSSNIYIEFYNSKKNLIYRTQFTSNTKLERKVQGTYFINISDTIYKDAKYAKVTVIKDSEWGNATSSLVCSNETTRGIYTFTEKVTYNFSEMGLLNYKVSRKITTKPNDNEEGNNTNTGSNERFKEAIVKESKIIEKTNISDLNYDDETIEYTVDLKNLNVKNSGYTPLYSHGSLIRTIRLSETENNWMCE